MKLKELMDSKEFILLDGAMGTQLQNKGMLVGGCPERENLDNPHWITEIHKSYITDGADIIYTNTFGANAQKLKRYSLTPEQVIPAAVKLAKLAVEDTGTLIALDIGPIGQLLEPIGSISFDEAYELFAQQVRLGVQSGVDLIAIETMTDLMEVKAALLAVKENSNLPVICTMSFEENMRTFTGCDIPSMALTLEGLGADAIGINCSIGPLQMVPLIEQLLEWTNLPVVIKPNAGLPNLTTGDYDLEAKEFADCIVPIVKLGVKVIGGCCGTDPEYISNLKSKLKGIKYEKKENTIPSAVCSSTKTVVIDRVRVIGERINPTGKKRFKEALISHDMNYILSQAIEQVNAGADILDVNVGLPEVDEKEMLVETIKSIQSITDTPLQIDSTDKSAIEAALRVYCGKPIVNSVNGDPEVLEAILPIVKKYGAAVIGLTLDEKGLPQTAQARFEIAQKILDAAIGHGIRREDVYIDCLTLTVSAEQKATNDTLTAIEMVKNRLGLKTVLGVSNISFGLPMRQIINQNFLMMAMTKGLDLPIINPNVETMMSAVRSYHLLTNIDKNAVEYIAEYGGAVAEKPVTEVGEQSLSESIKKGLKGDAATLTKKMLSDTDPMEIINNILTPALDEVGLGFESGKLFLPQLIQSAVAAQASFEVIKSEMLSQSKISTDKGTIVLATVKGDIHDIGKNIVKVILENYGYKIIDLGKDVEPQTIVDAVIKYKAPLVGMSALMTTTLKSMEETITLLHEKKLPCKVMVGGAVLTQDFAIKIGADYYGKNAKESADIAKLVFSPR